jgi:hypothetical protein
MNEQLTKTVGLFCNARDEKNIKEWAAHHLLIGFDIIIIFDHKSQIPLTSVFDKFDKRVIIIKLNTEEDNIKIALMNRATNIANKLNMDWFIYLDADEFLIINNKFRGVKHLLNHYSQVDSLGINWLMFGSNHLIQEPSGLILENYTKSCQMVDQHVKTFVRPNEVTSSDNPHYYHIKNPRKMVGLTLNVLSYPQCFNKILMSYAEMPAYIAHYIYQSEETYFNRKIKLDGDDGAQRQNLGKEIHNLYNDVENLQPQKYIKQIKKFLHP